jgi:outer membrane protein
VGEQGAQALSALAQGAQLHAAATAAFSRFDAAAVNLRIAQDSARLAEARQAAGAATLGDKLQAQTALAQSKLEHNRAMTQWLTARAALSVAMGLPAATPLSLAASESLDLLERDTPLDLPDLAAQASQDHPRVLAARARVLEARHRLDAVKAERWGTVSFNARAARARTFADGSPSRENSAAVEWSIPLLDRGVQRSQEMDAGGQIMVREVALDDARRQVALQVWQEGQALQGERQNSRASRQVLESAEASLRAASERYRLGAGSFADLLNAQSAAASARLQKVESQASLLQAHLRLAAAVGRVGTLNQGKQPAERR